MADLKTNELSTQQGRQPGQDADGRASVAPEPDQSGGPGGPDGRGRATGLRASLRGAAAAVTPAALWRNHRLFTILVLLSLAPRVLAALSFRPALLSADSFLYMANAVNGKLGNIRPSGYSFFLSIFRVLPHTLLAVTTAQHLMGIAIAVIVYALLRYWGLPGWGAALATVPTLFDTREIALESYILPDTVFCLVILLVVALLLTKRTPRLWQCVVAGLLLAYASVLRGNGIPLVVVVAAFLLVRKVGWKAFVAGGIAFVIPLLGYVLAFHVEYGKYNLTSSDGIFLWSRTTSFANCAVIKPPPDLRPLCPNLEKSVKVPPAQSWSISHLLSEPTSADYLWARDVWWRTDAHPGINSYNNKLGQNFAIHAVEAQPLDYLRVVGRDVLLTFAATDRPQGSAYMTFTPRPRIASLPSYYQDDIRAYAGTTSNTHAVSPYAFFMFLYQQPVFFPGLVFLLVVLAGLAGVLRNWRRWGGLQGLPWALAAVSILSPALLTQSLYRYTIVAIPLACLAAGLSFARLPRRRVQRLMSAGPVAAGTAPAGAAPADTDQAGTDQAGTDQAGTDQAGTAQAGTAQAGTAQAGTAQAGTAPAAGPASPTGEAGSAGQEPSAGSADPADAVWPTGSTGSADAAGSAGTGEPTSTPESAGAAGSADPAGPAPGGSASPAGIWPTAQDAGPARPTADPAPGPSAAATPRPPWDDIWPDPRRKR